MLACDTKKAKSYVRRAEGKIAAFARAAGPGEFRPLGTLGKDDGQFVVGRGKLGRHRQGQAQGAGLPGGILQAEFDLTVLPEGHPGNRSGFEADTLQSPPGQRRINDGHQDIYFWKSTRFILEAPRLHGYHGPHVGSAPHSAGAKDPGSTCRSPSLPPGWRPRRSPSRRRPNALTART